MPLEIRVGPSQLVIHYGSTVLVTDASGEISARAQLGLFSLDTRFLSVYSLSINEEKWVRVQATPLGPQSHRIHFTNAELRPLDGEVIPARSLGLQLDRTVGEELEEQMTLRNYCGRRVELRVGVRVDSDFADLFDVRNLRFVSRGLRDSYWDAARRELSIAYCNRDFLRTLVYRIGASEPAPHYSNGQILFALTLEPGGCWQMRNVFSLLFDGASPDRRRARPGCQPPGPAASGWQASATRLRASRTSVNATYRQAVEDVCALRLHDYDHETELWVPAAGVPWYMTLFGRDSLWVSHQCMMVFPQLAVGALAKLAEFQASEEDPYRDAEPGKIMHEMRYGELAHFKLIPHRPYYGSANATILYPIVLSELFRWVGDRSLLERFREPALRCLSWIDHYGDRDGDGFQEYMTRSPIGYYNQSWKDAGDAVVYPDGRLVKRPIATCELQGYVYQAKRRMAEIFEVLGESALSERVLREAEELKERFNRAFWLPEHGFVAYCLDGDKRPVATIASNPGHCLWSGIVAEQYAGAVAERLFRDDMWNGWGVRTLSADNPAYNPYEYQRGSVWPHDNGILAAGLDRYGFSDLANRIALGLFEAASMFEQSRLPELFAGHARGRDPFPVQSLFANVPQAWASGSIFELLRTVLGLHPDAARATLYVNPHMPERLGEVTLEGLQVGGCRVSLRFWREAGQDRFDVIEARGERLKFESGAPPWFNSAR